VRVNRVIDTTVLDRQTLLASQPSYTDGKAAQLDDDCD
jgi:hypothetical protein